MQVFKSALDGLEHCGLPQGRVNAYTQSISSAGIACTEDMTVLSCVGLSHAILYNSNNSNRRGMLDLSSLTVQEGTLQAANISITQFTRSLSGNYNFCLSVGHSAPYSVFLDACSLIAYGHKLYGMFPSQHQQQHQEQQLQQPAQQPILQRLLLAAGVGNIAIWYKRKDLMLDLRSCCASGKVRGCLVIAEELWEEIGVQCVGVASSQVRRRLVWRKCDW
mgnify:CR=1 FL=1